MKQQFIILCFAMSINTAAEAQFANTLDLDESATSPGATLSGISWLAGHWRGEAFGGITEEIWTPPLGNSMMSAFKVVIDGKIKFYEFVTILEENGSLVLRLKHFHADMKGWEEKDVTQDFRLVKATPNRIYFQSFTIERVSNNEMNMYVVIGKDGDRDEMKFNYRRVSPKAN